MVIDISAIISILGPLNSDLLTDKLLENYKHKHQPVRQCGLERSSWCKLIKILVCGEWCVLHICYNINNNIIPPTVLHMLLLNYPRGPVWNWYFHYFSLNVSFKHSRIINTRAPPGITGSWWSQVLPASYSICIANDYLHDYPQTAGHLGRDEAFSLIEGTGLAQTSCHGLLSWKSNFVCSKSPDCSFNNMKKKTTSLPGYLNVDIDLVCV